MMRPSALVVASRAISASPPEESVTALMPPPPSCARAAAGMAADTRIAFANRLEKFINISLKVSGYLIHRMVEEQCCSLVFSARVELETRIENLILVSDGPLAKRADRHGEFVAKLGKA